MRKTASLFSLLAVLLAFGCSPKTYTAATPDEMEVRNLDTMVVTPEANGVIASDDFPLPPPIPNERPVYREAYKRTHDLLHTKLELSFNWEKEQVIGVATLKLTPLFHPSNMLTLDAKGFTFNSIKTAAGKTLSYDYGEDQQHVTIALDREYKKGEEYTLVIDYVATPEQSGGSAAITSDKGLFFINPRGEEEGKPRQIWTQGETENNSRWFPTIDKPNERCTQEIYVTVDEKYKTLSNGVLQQSAPAGNGMRTDYWKMDQPHAPYLFALVVGDFDVVEDEKWNGIPVNYYMEKGWKDHAKDIYPYTREMLTFFSDLTGVQYPWPKYSQVAVRDYVSGAMENTTAVIFGEFMHGTARDLIDVETNEKIVAHEMFHHWFGDYVTCESWSNLTLNEGFANYSEYLWMEKKHGRDAADHHMMGERSGYFGSVQRGEPHELIWYDYEDKEQMFDAHSYNKGGAVLHMLRGYLGDEAFFASLEYYLTENQYSPVEVDELRMAFEEITGEDLNWFFDQWFLSAGHPQLSLDTKYADGEVMLTITQTQSTENNVPGVFRLPTQVAVFTNGSTVPKMYDIVVDERTQTFTFPSSVMPDVVVFDPRHDLLAQFDYTKTASELAAQFKAAPTVVDRILVLQRLARKDDSAERTATVTAALNDDFHAVRSLALRLITENVTPAQMELIKKLALNDPHSEVRSGAIELLGAMEADGAEDVAVKALNARPYPVVAAGMGLLAELNPARAAEEAANLETVDNNDIQSALAEIYAKSGNVSKLPYFEERLKTIDGFPAISLAGSYVELLRKADPEKLKGGLDMLKNMAINQASSPYRRIAATKSINDLREGMKAAGADATEIAALKAMIDEIKAAETMTELKQIYQQYGN